MHHYSIIDGWMSTEDDISLKSAYTQGNNSVENYQKDQLDESLKYIQNFRTAIDIGAHIGIMSFNMSKKFTKIHAFEIQTDVYNCLAQNLKNKDISNVDHYNVGIGNKEENVDLNFEKKKTFSTHVKPSSTGKYQIKTLDSFNFVDVDFIKIDAEGYEPLIALGGINTIKKCKPAILFERKNHPTRYGYERNSIIEILEPFGYKIIKEFGRKNALIGVISE